MAIKDLEEGCKFWKQFCKFFRQNLLYSRISSSICRKKKKKKEDLELYTLLSPPPTCWDYFVWHYTGQMLKGLCQFLHAYILTKVWKCLVISMPLCSFIPGAFPRLEASRPEYWISASLSLSVNLGMWPFHMPFPISVSFPNAWEGTVCVNTALFLMLFQGF